VSASPTPVDIPPVLSPGRLQSRVIGGNAPLRGRLIGLVWLAVLIGPLTSAFDLPGRQSIIAGSLVVIFGVVYAVLFVTVSPGSQRRDFVVVGLLTVIAVILPAAFGEEFWLPLLFAATSAVMVLPWRVGLAALGFINAYAIGCGLVLGWTADQLGDVVISCGLASMVVLSVSRLVRTIGALKVAEGQLARAAVNEERMRISRDMHDLLGHSLTTIVVKSALASRLSATDQGRAAREMADVERIARSALGDVRETVSGYRSLSLAQELDGAREVLAAGGVACTVTPADRALPARVEAVLAWGVREAVTNVLRHARATRCEIVLSASDESATLDVTDDGVGVADLAVGAVGAVGAGLTGLSERLAAAGGRLVSGSMPGGGFRLHAELPVGA
jgi:two-component system sensor histidine kinase DesK